MPYQKRPFLVFLALALLVIVVPLAREAVLAQSGQARRQATSQRHSASGARRHAERRPTMPPVVSRQLPEFITGERVVTITGTTTTTFDIGLAKYGVCLIEYTDTDVVYKVHPGDEGMVTVDRSSRGRDPIVLRPGKLFVVPDDDSRPVPISIVTIQMGSGAIFSFRIFPVRNASQNANRVVLSYNREDIVRARVRAGLPVNFKPALPASAESVEVTQAASQSEAAPSQAQVVVNTEQPSPTPQPAPAPSRPTVVDVESIPQYIPASASHGSTPSTQSNAVTRPVPTPSQTPTTRAPVRSTALVRPAHVETAATGTQLPSLLRDRMKQAVAANNFSRFSPATHGLAVAMVAPVDLDNDTQYVVMAVRNTLSTPIRLLPEQPELSIETLDRHRRPVMTGDAVKIKLIETTLPTGNVLLGGATCYFIVAYAPPILGANQSLRISIGPTLAADEPSIVDLSITSR